MTTMKLNPMVVVTVLAVAVLAFMAALPALAQGQRGGGCCLTAPAVPVTTEEATWMTHMREEEKLARDVYTQLNERWNLRIFANIAVSEQRHYDAVGTLMARYNVAEPASGTTPGVYTDAGLAALYSELMAKGALSLKDALEVGVLIEKTDIADLQTALQATTKTDIKTVYTNLLDASIQHQDRFEAMLEVVQ